MSSEQPYDHDKVNRALEDKLAEMIIESQIRADRSAAKAREDAERAKKARSRLRNAVAKTRTRQLIETGAIFVKAAGGELTVQQANYIANKLVVAKAKSGKSLMATFVEMARTEYPAP